MRISQMAATSASIYLNKSTEKLNKSAERLASGKRILTAGDDPSGLMRATSMKAQIGQYTMGTSNMKDMKAFADTKDSALENLSELAQKITEAYAQKEGLTSESDKTAIDASITAYTAEANDIISNTIYNGKNVFDKEALTASSGNGGTFSMSASSLVDESTGASKLDFSSADEASKSLSAILSERAQTGAYQNSLDARISINEKMTSNLEDAYSRIVDVDIEKETIEYNKQLILQQSAQAMIRQQNSNMSSILNLLG